MVPGVQSAEILNSNSRSTHPASHAVAYRLETFGGLALYASNGAAIQSQRRRLALLALLAASGERGLTREQLIGYLWADTSEESARHALDQLLYAIRRAMGDEVFSGVSPLRLNPDIVSADVALFEDALAHGKTGEAAALYKGPFLEGFYVSEAPEFERWVERERARLIGRYAQALQQLGTAAEREGAFSAAVDWRRKLAALHPLDAPHAAALMRALAASGNIAGALEHARTYESLVKIELDASPDPAVVHLARALRDEMSLASGRVAAPAQARSSPGEAPPSPATSAPPAPPTPPTPPTHGSSLNARVLTGALVTILVAAAFATFNILRNPSIESCRPMKERPSAASRIAVMPARTAQSDSASTQLREGIMDLIVTSLTGDGMPAAADARATLNAVGRSTRRGSDPLTPNVACAVARAVGAGSALMTDLAREDDGRLRLTARLVAASDGSERARATARGPADSLTSLIDRLLAALLAHESGEDRERVATLTSAFPPAVSEFLAGRAEHRRGHDVAAMRHFSRALDLDSTFALAGLELAATPGLVVRWRTLSVDTVPQTLGLGARGPLRTSQQRDEWERALSVAWREQKRLSRRDRVLLLALAGPRYPGASYASEMLAAWDGALNAAPDRPDALYSVGYLLLFQGRALGLADALGRARASFHSALELDSSFVSPIVGLLEIAAEERDVTEARRLRALYLHSDSVGPQADYVRWLGAAVVADQAALRTIRSRFDSLDIQSLSRIQSLAQLKNLEIDDADRASQSILRRSSERRARQIAWHSAFMLALNRGLPLAALDILDKKRDVDPTDDLRQALRIRGALFGDGDEAAGAATATALASCLPPSGLPERRRVGGGDIRCGPNAAFGVALWRVLHGDTAGVRAEIARERVIAARRKLLDAQPQLLAALISAADKSPEAPVALQRLDSMALLGCCNLPHFISLATARLHEGAGNFPAALAALRRGPILGTEYLSTYLREEGRLAAITGDTAGAIRAYEHYVALRSRPEQSLRPQVDSIHVALERLKRGR
jgi:DNA-binding SARP family transcriptional activator